MEKENDEMQAIVLLNKDIKLNKIDHVRVIRIKDEKYNLLIMKDYWPVIGEINGSVYFEADKDYAFENIKAFYTLSHNIFHLIMVDDKVEENKELVN